MNAKQGWSRRNFVQMIGTVALGSRAVASTFVTEARSTANTKARFAFVGCAGGGADAIEVFSFANGQMQRIQSVQSHAPVAMALSSDGRYLYIANQIAQYAGLPRGTVEAYTVGDDGKLALLNRQELSLAATMPRHLAIAPDGKSILVTASGGGLYNFFPIAGDGSIGRTQGIYKVTGDLNGRQAAPRMALFDGAGRVLSADEGTGQLKVFNMAEDALSPYNSHVAFSSGAPRQIAFHAKAKSVYVAHSDAIEAYGYDLAAGLILARRQRLAGTGVADGSSTMTIHPTKDILLASDNESGVVAWAVAEDGSLRYAGRHAGELGQLSAIEIAPSGREMITLSNSRGEIAVAILDAATGYPAETKLLARVSSPHSLAVVYS